MASKNDMSVFLATNGKKFRHTIIFEDDEIVGGIHAEEI
jgi:hypothetical protein